MKSNQITSLIKGYQLVVPSVLLRYYKDLKLSAKELIFLSYLLPLGETVAFDIVTIEKDISYSPEEIMEVTSLLCEKSLLSLIVKKDQQNLMKDYLDLSFLHNKLLSLTLGEEINEPVIEIMEKDNIYEEIEREFGRTLSPIEYETIKGWIESNIDITLIHEALKEAVLNGVNNLKYIDRILFEWTKKGYNKPRDIKKKSNAEELIDIFDYDWLKETDE